MEEELREKGPYGMWGRGWGSRLLQVQANEMQGAQDMDGCTNRSRCVRTSTSVCATAIVTSTASKKAYSKLLEQMFLAVRISHSRSIAETRTIDQKHSILCMDTRSNVAPADHSAKLYLVLPGRTTGHRVLHMCLVPRNRRV